MRLNTHAADKVHSLSSLIEQVGEWKQDKETVVFTNGCFDILHRGHIKTLEQASQLGDRLIVGLNSDSSVKRLKGENRPLQDEDGRALVLAALAVVDLVVVFEEDTPLQLITNIKPDVLVKGGDYKPITIVGYNEVVENGGEVVIIPLEDGYSTTNIEQKIKGTDPTS